jgi:hypothetical protein
MQQKYYLNAFAVSGDVTPEIPDAADPSNYVSYYAGFTFDYQRNLVSDTLAKSILRINFNAIMNDVTTNVQDYQHCGTPEFITSAQNGGVAFPYRICAMVRYSTSGVAPFGLYINLVDSNTNVPTAANSGWVPFASAFPIGVGTITVPTTFTGANAGNAYTVAGTASTITLTASSFAPFQTIGFVTFIGTVITTSTGTFYGAPGITGTSVTVPTGSNLFIQWDGANWRVLSASPNVQGFATVAALSAETSRAEAAESAETSRATSAEALKATIVALSAETSRAEAAEALKGNLSGANTWSGTNTFSLAMTTAAINAGASINASGVIQANGGSGKLRAAVGAYGSGDANCAVILNDFTTSFAGNGYRILPNGDIEVWGSTGITTSGAGLTSAIITIPIAFPIGFLWAIANFDGTTPPASGSCAAQGYSNSQIEITVYAPGASTYGIVYRAIGH